MTRIQTLSDLQPGQRATVRSVCAPDGMQRRLRALGVQELAQNSAPVTAEEARRLLHSGLPVTGRLTPLARDVLEGRA